MQVKMVQESRQEMNCIKGKVLEGVDLILNALAAPRTVAPEVGANSLDKLLFRTCWMLTEIASCYDIEHLIPDAVDSVDGHARAIMSLVKEQENNVIAPIMKGSLLIKEKGGSFSKDTTGVLINNQLQVWKGEQNVFAYQLNVDNPKVLEGMISAESDSKATHAEHHDFKLTKLETGTLASFGPRFRAPNFAQKLFWINCIRFYADRHASVASFEGFNLAKQNSIMRKVHRSDNIYEKYLFARKTKTAMASQKMHKGFHTEGKFVKGDGANAIFNFKPTTWQSTELTFDHIHGKTGHETKDTYKATEIVNSTLTNNNLTLTLVLNHDGKQKNIKWISDRGSLRPVQDSVESAALQADRTRPPRCEFFYNIGPIFNDPTHNIGPIFDDPTQGQVGTVIPMHPPDFLAAQNQALEANFMEALRQQKFQVEGKEADWQWSEMHSLEMSDDEHPAIMAPEGLWCSKVVLQQVRDFTTPHSEKAYNIIWVDAKAKAQWEQDHPPENKLVFQEPSNIAQKPGGVKFYFQDSGFVGRPYVTNTRVGSGLPPKLAIKAVQGGNVAFLPYESDSATAMIIPSTAEFCITTTISGCDFFVFEDSSSNDIQPLVVHLEFTFFETESAWAKVLCSVHAARWVNAKLKRNYVLTHCFRQGAYEDKAPCLIAGKKTGHEWSWHVFTNTTVKTTRGPPERIQALPVNGMQFPPEHVITEVNRREQEQQGEGRPRNIEQ